MFATPTFPPPTVPGPQVFYQASAPRQRTAIACQYCRRRKVCSQTIMLLTDTHTHTHTHIHEANAFFPAPRSGAPGLRIQQLGAARTAFGSTSIACSRPCRRRKSPSVPPVRDSSLRTVVLRLPSPSRRILSILLPRLLLLLPGEAASSSASSIAAPPPIPARPCHR